jgi:hypothetical protein
MIDGATSSTPLKGDRFGRKDTGQSIIEWEGSEEDRTIVSEDEVSATIGTLDFKPEAETDSIPRPEWQTALIIVGSITGVAIVGYSVFWIWEKNNHRKALIKKGNKATK